MLLNIGNVTLRNTISVNSGILFHVILMDGDGATVTYPNSMVFQKAVKITQNKPSNMNNVNKTDIDTEKK